MQNSQDNHYFHFTRKERNGTLFLLFIMLLLVCFPFLYPFIFKNKPVADNQLNNELAVLKTKQADSSVLKKTWKYRDSENYKQGFTQKKDDKGFNEGTLFPFDPNNLSAEGWEKLGLREKNISTIQNYLSKGGKFRQPEDLKKIWGLPEALVMRLIPYIKIAHKIDTNSYAGNKYEYKSTKNLPAIQFIDINQADSVQWMALPGIGSKLSGRILNFREKLGGFYNIEQVKETFGLPDSVFEKIRPKLLLNNKEIKQLNINLATLDELKQHPYIRYQLANLIIQYRNQHGRFSAVADLKKIMVLKEEVYNKMAPYLKTE